MQFFLILIEMNIRSALLELRPSKIDVSTITADEKQYIGQSIADGKTTAKQFRKLYHISESTLSKWKKVASNGGKFSEGTGRPSSFDEETRAYARQLLEAKNFNITFDTFVESLKEFIQNRGIPQSMPVMKSFKNLLDELGAKTGFAEEITQARYDAVRDIRNIVSFAAMNSSRVGESIPQLIMNMDSTQFGVGKTNNKVEVVYLGNREELGTLKAQPQLSNFGGVCYFIKFYLLITAFGWAADPVFVIADDSMIKGQLDVYEVPEFGVSTTVGCKGYIVFCHSRAASLEFHDWFNNSILVPFVAQIRDLNEGYKNIPCWYQLDGEPIQMQAVTNKKAIETFNAFNIKVGKPPASTTAITQPCHVGKCFLGSKSALKGINDCDVEDDVLMPSLTKVFKDHITKYSRSKGAVESNTDMDVEDELEEHQQTAPTKQRMSPSHVKMAKIGLLRIRAALPSGIKSNTIKDSFKLTGVYPFCLETILNNCKSVITNEQRVTIADAMPQLVASFEATGQFKEKDFHDLNIGEGVKRGKPKDQLPLWRRRSVEITHAAVARELLADAANKATEKAAKARKKTLRNSQQKAKKSKKL